MTCIGLAAIVATEAGSSCMNLFVQQKGYFWYVSPTSRGSLNNGWQHLCRAGPFDGKLFHEE